MRLNNRKTQSFETTTKISQKYRNGTHGELLTKLQAFLYISLQLIRDGQVLDSLRDLLVVGLQVVVDVAQLLHDARHVVAGRHARDVQAEAGAQAELALGTKVFTKIVISVVVVYFGLAFCRLLVQSK